MTDSRFNWESLLRTDAPAGSVLKAALFTTYDRADERLLAEHLLPLLLKLTREPDGEGSERQFFLLELDQRLKRLHDKVVVVSSTLREEPLDDEVEETGTYGWIWRNIRHLTVGSQRKAVQHAKLWLLHWGAPDGEVDERLEIVVSSCNLTLSAFKGQLQAAWRVCLPLYAQRAASRLRGWGVLPAFINELAASAGDGECLAAFVELLARADCPDGASFVASVPGTHSRQVLRRTPWGFAGLGAIAPRGKGTVRASILSPYIGSWTADRLRRWCASFDGAPERMELVWIDKQHPWARLRHWLLPKTSLSALLEAKGKILRLRREVDDPDLSDRFHEDHRHTDDRWSHAKVYGFQRGNSRRVLVTSANFSVAAWGSEAPNGDLTIENFEIGVCLDRGVWPFDDLESLEDPRDAATVTQLPRQGAATITWAQATWDGKRVEIDCRCEAAAPLDGAMQAGQSWIQIVEWKAAPDGRLRAAKVPWRIAEPSPSTVRLTCGAETLTVDIFDCRPSPARELSVPPEVDPDIAETLRDELLFEQYGGRAPPDSDTEEGQPDPEDRETDEGGGEVDGAGDGGIGPDAEPDDGATAARQDSYAVPAFVLARRHLGVVDNWAQQVERVTSRRTADFERAWLRRDGELLFEAFKRQAVRDERRDIAGPTRAIGAKLAAEELALRLKHFPEG